MDHQASISIWQMITSRLPFLDVSDSAYETSVSPLILEKMYEFETCFNVDKDDPDPTHIGDEQYYSVPQKALLADVLSVFILERQLLSNMDLGSTDTEVDTYVSKAGAGSASVEFDQVDLRKVETNSVDVSRLISSLKKSAISKGIKLGCELVFLEEGGLEVSCVSCDTPFLGFVVKTE